MSTRRDAIEKASSAIREAIEPIVSEAMGCGCCGPTSTELNTIIETQLALLEDGALSELYDTAEYDGYLDSREPEPPW